jgi:Kef-type K+ transport system membrane component KefB
VVLAAYVAGRVPQWFKGTRISSIVSSTAEDTTQSVLRWTIALLLGALLLTADFGLDIVLGAFLAGMVLRRSYEGSEGGEGALLGKLDSIAYGFFIPIFFISSGMSLDIDSIAENPARLVVFFVLLFAVRGLPSLLIYRRQLATGERWQMVFLTATALPLIVALTNIGVENGTMLPENAAALVGAGALSVAVFPFLALQIRRRTRVTA